MPSWKSWYTTAAVLVFVAVFALLAVIATQLSVSRHNHLGFWSAVVIGVLLLLLMLAAGAGVIGRWDGILIDGRNRISLSQLQLVIWTIVVLASFSGAYFTNLLADVDPVKAIDISLPPELWLALGISAVALVGSKGLNAQQGGNQQPEAIPAAAPNPPDRARMDLVRGSLLVRGAASKASWNDIFASDYVQDGARVDVAKVQMFCFTIILAFGYAASVANLLITAHGPVTALPSLDTGFVTLLALSQGGYLASKTVKG